jgi:hypothetical protein
MKSILRLTIRLVILSILIFLTAYLIESVFKLQWIHNNISIIISFFLILTWLTGVFTYYLLSISKENSVNILLGSIGIRLLGSIGFVVVMLLLGQENIILFVINFFVVYLFYLLFDINMLIANLRQNSE